MEDPANAALHLITFAFGATLWAMPKHKDLVVKMLPFFLGAWLGFTSPDLAKFPMGSECNGIFGIDMLRPNPGWTGIEIYCHVACTQHLSRLCVHTRCAGWPRVLACAGGLRFMT
eukprot:COSAG03_NODE_905_length_5401_cov_2.949830_4_plen_114_part_01